MCKCDLVVIGHLLKERIIFADGREIGPVLGGPAAYSSVAAAQAGLKVGLVSVIGRDMPDDLLDVFGEAGVDMQGVQKDDRGTENRLVYDNAGNKRLEFLNKARLLKVGDIPEAYLDARMLLICPIDYEVPLSLLEELLPHNADMAVDLGGYGGASSQAGRLSMQEKLCYLDEIIPCFKLVKGSREDVQSLFEGNKPADEGFLAEMAEKGVPLSIVTQGSAGALVQEGGEISRIPSFTGNAIDTTGAGDSWFGAFLAEYIRGRNACEAAVFASAFASIMVERSGGVSLRRMPARDEVEKRMKI